MVGISECSEIGSTKIYCSNLSCKKIYGVVNLARECQKQFEPHCLKKVKKLLETRLTSIILYCTPRTPIYYYLPRNLVTENPYYTYSKYYQFKIWYMTRNTNLCSTSMHSLYYSFKFWTWFMIRLQEGNVELIRFWQNPTCLA